MKRLIMAIIISCLLFAVPAFGEVTFHNANEATVEWSAVTTDVDGDLITQAVQYRIYLANANTDPDKASPTLIVDGLTGLSYTVTLETKGRYFVGASAFDGEDESVINWADEIENQGDNPLFGLRWKVSPHTPKNIKK